jgi:hypothetical protein
MIPPSAPPPPEEPSPSTPPTPGMPSGSPPPMTSWQDPSGVWAHFLSMGGQKATPQDVAVFFRTLLSFFNVIIQQNAAAAQRSFQYEQQVIEGQA